MPAPVSWAQAPAVKPTKAGKKMLKKKGKLKAKMRFTFTPNGGDPYSVVETVQVKAKR